MGGLLQTLNDMRTKIEHFKEKRVELTEADTKAKLINPVLRALGWDVENSDDVAMEDKGSNKSHYPPDYILLLAGKPKLLVEAKRFGERLDGNKYADQLMGYVGAAAVGVEWIVLTNGDDYLIYNATACVSSFEERLFCKVSVSESNSPSERMLALLAKKQIDTLPNHWETFFADRKVRRALEQLFATPDESLAHLVRKHVDGLASKEIKKSLTRMSDQFVRLIKSDQFVPPLGAVAPTIVGPNGEGDDDDDDEDKRISLKDLIDAGVLKPPVELTAHYEKHELKAQLRKDGVVILDGNEFKSCSKASAAALSSVTHQEMHEQNGWKFWQYKNDAGELVLLDAAREEYTKQQAK